MAISSPNGRIELECNGSNGWFLNSATTWVQRVIGTNTSTGTFTGTYSTTTGAQPTSSGGVALWSQSITPQRSNSRLLIECEIAGVTGADSFILALFQDSGTSCVQMSVPNVEGQGAGVMQVHRLVYDMANNISAGTTTTFKLRIGSNSGNSFWLNSFNGTPTQQQGITSFFRITEYFTHSA